MNPQGSTKNILIVLAILIVVGLVVGYAVFWGPFSASPSTAPNTSAVPPAPFVIPESTSEAEIVCPADIKVCPSGGSGTPRGPIELRRVPPLCEFPECPG